MPMNTEELLPEGEDEAPLALPAAPPAEFRLDALLEALLLAADQPLSMEQLLRLLAPELGSTRKDLRAALEQLALRLQGSASELREVAGGWRLQVRAEYSEWIARLYQEKPPKFTRAMLETLALICYRQPITRGEIEEIRGVAVSSNILRTLLERGWVREVGHKEVPGRPALFGTTPQFLDDLGLKSLDELPTLPEVRDLEQLEAALNRLESAAADRAAEANDMGTAIEADDAAAPPPSTQSLH
jgi:segregation and condensation protein B